MMRFSCFILLLVATPVFPWDWSLTMGVSDWEPNLAAVRQALKNDTGGDLVADSESGRYFNMSFQTERGWQTFYSTRWLGRDSQSGSKLDAHNIGLTSGVLGPFGVTAGFGGNIVSLNRSGAFTDGTKARERHNYLWGLHATGGVLWSYFGFLSFEIRHTRHWIKKATFDGVEYDMSGSMWSGGVGLLF